MSSIPITADYAQAVGAECKKVENRSLILDKLAQASKDWETGAKDNQAKRNSLQRLSARNIEQDSAAESRKKHTLRFLSLLKKTYEKDHRLAIVYAKLESRLAINLADGIIENAGMSLDRIYGLPIIPGSAVKGAARHAAWEEKQDAPDGEKADVDERMLRVFGYDNDSEERDPDNLKQGAVSFLQAMPYGKTDIVVDIVNCHYPKYYNPAQNAQPTQKESPNPCYFPVVEAGAEFAFPIVLNDLDSDPKLLDYAVQWLETALFENGIGAKTAAGYGWFSPGSIPKIPSLNAEVSQELLDQFQASDDATISKYLNGIRGNDPKIPEIHQETFRRTLLQFLMAKPTPTKKQQQVIKQLNEEFNVK